MLRSEVWDGDGDEREREREQMAGGGMGALPLEDSCWRCVKESLLWLE